MREIRLTIGNYQSMDGRNLIMLSSSDEKLFYLFERDQAASLLDDLEFAINKMEV